jgi:hypothetical protein
VRFLWKLSSITNYILSQQARQMDLHWLHYRVKEKNANEPENMTDISVLWCNSASQANFLFAFLTRHEIELILAEMTESGSFLRPYALLPLHHTTRKTLKNAAAMFNSINDRQQDLITCNSSCNLQHTEQVKLSNTYWDSKTADKQCQDTSRIKKYSTQKNI